MLTNYHTHTTRCNHAAGTDREYVQAALDSGIQLLGFSDHAPFPDHAFVGMLPEELPGYISSLRSLRDEFHSSLEMHIGLELEYDPKEFPAQLAFLKEHQVEYLILGQHALFGLEDAPGIHAPCGQERYLDHHSALQREAMDTGVITYIAHPDVFNFSGSKEVYERHVRKLCRHARDLRIPLEINLLGLRTHRHYPRDHFWQIAGEEGCQVIFGCDAHDPRSFLDETGPAAAKALVRRFGLDLIQTTSLRSL